MKTWLAPLSLALGILLVSGVWLRGQGAKGPDDSKEKRTINTSGSATLRAKPDSARVFFSVQTTAPTIKGSRAENNTKFNQVTAALKALKIDGLKMKTADVSLEPVFTQRPNDDQPKITGYRVTHQFTVLLTNTDAEKLSGDAGRVLDTVLENGANIVQRIVFFKADDAALRREAMAKAVENAVTNAKALATGANVKLADTIAISGSPEYYWSRGNDNIAQQAVPAAAGGGGDDTHVVAGDVIITCNVSVTCTY
jgi:uncharacterized protein YggE